MSKVGSEADAALRWLDDIAPRLWQQPATRSEPSLPMQLEVRAAVAKAREAVAALDLATAALREIADLSLIPDAWEPYVGPFSDFASYPTEAGQPPSRWTDVDDSNMGDVHGHGVAEGLWLAAKLARGALRGEEGR